jgi:hypothetical protein
MPKLNKIFLAIVIALLITAVAEVIFIFVYKPVETIPTPVIQATPNPTPNSKLAVNPVALQMLQTWPSYKNTNLTMSLTIKGTITNIVQTKGTKDFHIILNGDPGTDMTNISITEKNFSSTTVYFQSGSSITKASIEDLKANENIVANINEDLGIDPNNATLQTTIYILK